MQIDQKYEHLNTHQCEELPKMTEQGGNQDVSCRPSLFTGTPVTLIIAPSSSSVCLELLFFFLLFFSFLSFLLHVRYKNLFFFLISSQFLFFLPQCPLHRSPLSLRLIIMIRLQAPRLALRRRLNALSGGVSRPTPWRRRPIAFLCYVLSASALRPLANRVRVEAGWPLIGQSETICYFSVSIFCLLSTPFPSSMC